MIITHMNWRYSIEFHGFDNGFPGDESTPPDEPSIDFSVLYILSNGGDYADLLTPADLETKIIEKLTESEL